jgi:hypothetical protein
MVDLERREVLDVLTDRSTDGTAKWVAHYPEVEDIVAAEHDAAGGERIGTDDQLEQRALAGAVGPIRQWISPIFHRQVDAFPNDTPPKCLQAPGPSPIALLRPGRRLQPHRLSRCQLGHRYDRVQADKERIEVMVPGRSSRLPHGKFTPIAHLRDPGAHKLAVG